MSLSLILGATFLVAACGSMSKDTMETKLAALGKNQPLVERGLRRLPIVCDLGAGSVTLELVHSFVPATALRSEAAPVVLVHGTPGTLFNWTEVILGVGSFPGLAADRDVYALEMLGHGLAPGDPEPFSFQKGARFLVAAVEALDLPPVHLVGQSYGGELAWRAALDRPDLFASLTLTSSSGYARTDDQLFPEEIEMRDNSLADYGWLINSEERVETALATHFDSLPPDRVEEFFLVCENSSNWRTMVDLVIDEVGSRQTEIANLDLPVLLLWGARDKAFPLESFAARFQSEIAGSQLQSVEAGHYPHEERPAEYGAALATFLTQVDSSSP